MSKYRNFTILLVVFFATSFLMILGVGCRQIIPKEQKGAHEISVDTVSVALTPEEVTGLDAESLLKIFGVTALKLADSSVAQIEIVGGIPNFQDAKDGDLFSITFRVKDDPSVEVTVQLQIAVPKFILAVQIPNDNTALTLPLRTPGDNMYNLRVDWGDGSLEDVTNQDEGVHAYASAGAYDISISGELVFGDIDSDAIDDGSWGIRTMPGRSGGFETFNTRSLASYKDFLIGIKSFGGVKFINNTYTFAELTNNITLPSDKSDIPYLEGDISYMFFVSRAFNQDLNHWDVSKVTAMSGLFNHAENFNGNITDWNVSSVDRMDGMFYYAGTFNQDLSKWNVASVIYFNIYDSGADSWTLGRPNFKE